MKIIITESQLNKMMNEVGGYDDHMTMNVHSSILHRELADMMNQLGDILGSFVHHTQNDGLSKQQVLIFSANASMLIGNISKRMGELENEILVDDDLRFEVVKIKSTLKKLSEYLNMLSSITKGRDGNNVRSGVGIEMSNEDMIEGITGKIKSSLDELRYFITLLRDVNQRIINRLEKN